MPRYPGRSPYLSKGLVETKVREIFESYPDSTFMVRDVARLVDSTVRDSPDDRPVHVETVRKVLALLDATDTISSRTGDDADFYRNHRTTGIRFFSTTSPVPVYTQVMAELFDEIPVPKSVPESERMRKVDGAFVRPDGQMTRAQKHAASQARITAVIDALDSLKIPNKTGLPTARRQLTTRVPGLEFNSYALSRAVKIRKARKDYVPVPPTAYPPAARGTLVNTITPMPPSTTPTPAVMPQRRPVSPLVETPVPSQLEADGARIKLMVDKLVQAAATGSVTEVARLKLENTELIEEVRALRAQIGDLKNQRRLAAQAMGLSIDVVV